MDAEKQELIDTLSSLSPKILQITFSHDMGYEFLAIVPGGVIFPEPGMMLNYDIDDFPIDATEADPKGEADKRVSSLLLDNHWNVTPWGEIDYDELSDILDLAVSD